MITIANTFSIHELIYYVNENANALQDTTSAKTDYKEALNKIRAIISQNHAEELVNVIRSAEASVRLKELITRYLNLNRLYVEGMENITELTDRIYDDMAGFGILSKYIWDPNIEEINVNAWNAIEVIYSNNRHVLVDETFVNAEDCVDKIKKMVLLGGSVIDGSNPIVDSFIGEGTRISAIIPPCTDPSAGAIASIRRQKPSSISRETLIQSETATAEELDFLSLCVNHGVSVALAGQTGSGKTTDLAYLLACLDRKKRIYTIEDTRELNIMQLKDGRMINRVIHTVTSDERVTMNDLLKTALRFHPDIIVPAEMRGAEAFTAMEAGRTGHTILTTLHANSAKRAYPRILSMCEQAGTGLSEDILLDFILEAIPIVLFKRLLPDGRRVYAEIFEGLGIENGKVVGNILYKYEVQENIIDRETGTVKVKGRHIKVNPPSEKLLERLRIGGASRTDLNRLYGKGRSD